MLNTDLQGTDLTALTAVDLRHYAAKLGIKGASKGRKADLLVALKAIQTKQVTERRRQDAAAKKELAAKIAADQAAKVAVPGTSIRANAAKGKCTECGRKEDFRASGLCTACREYGEAENAHSDESHGEQDEQSGANTADCPVCHPELDPRKPRSAGRSRAGMVIVAKGTEVHKSLLFKRTAEAKGWTVEISTEEYADGDETNTRHFADAHRGDEAIQLAWDGRAYDYDASSAKLNGRDRKVRNLKEALRLI